MPASYSWNLTPDPTPVVPSPSAVATAQAAASTAQGLPSFLGQGLLRPFRRDQKSDFAAGQGLDLVKAAIGQIIGTKCDSTTGPGELPWRTDFGSRIHLVRHRNNNQASDDLATVLVQEAISRWEPRVSVLTVTIEQTGNPRVKQVRVIFNVVDRGGRTLVSEQEATVDVAA